MANLIDFEVAELHVRGVILDKRLHPWEFVHIMMYVSADKKKMTIGHIHTSFLNDGGSIELIQENIEAQVNGIAEAVAHAKRVCKQYSMKPLDTRTKFRSGAYTGFHSVEKDYVSCSRKDPNMNGAVRLEGRDPNKVFGQLMMDMERRVQHNRGLV